MGLHCIYHMWTQCFVAYHDLVTLSYMLMKSCDWHFIFHFLDFHISINVLFLPSTLVFPFLPEASFGLRVLSLPASVRVGDNHRLVGAITRHSFKLQSPNLIQKCKTPWLRSLLFWCWLTLNFKVKFNFKLKIDLILSLSKPLLTTYSS